MRTKTLVSVAAAFAASALVAQAAVYSVNIVGYANKDAPAGGLKLMANPLDNNTNTISTVFTALPNGSTIFVWNGSGYTTSLKGKGVWSTNVYIPPGVGMFVKAGGTGVYTNTFVGQTDVNPGELATNALPPGVTTLVGSRLPYGGDLLNTNLNLGPVLPNGSTVFKWTGSNYQTSLKGKGVWSQNLTFDVAEGMFVKAGGVATVDWVQTINQ